MQEEEHLIAHFILRYESVDSKYIAPP